MSKIVIEKEWGALPTATEMEVVDILVARDIDKIEMDVREAKDSFACNFVSTGNKVIMGGAEAAGGD